MALVTVQDIQLLPVARELIAGFQLTTPTVGQQYTGHALDVTGWVVGQQAPALRIEVEHDHEVMRQADVWVLSPNVGKVLAMPRLRVLKSLLRHYLPALARLVRHCRQLQRLPTASATAPRAPKGTPKLRERKGPSEAEKLHAGFFCGVSALGLPRQFELRLVAVLADDSRIPLAILRGQRELLQTRYQPRRQPLLMTHLGRSGSTWLSHLLAEHPDIVIHRRYPYEAFAAVHTMRVMQVLTTPTNALRQEDLNAVNRNLSQIGPIPVFCPEDDPQLYNWLRQEYVQRHAEFCLQTIEALYDQIARQQGKESARYFSEKMFTFPRMSSLFTELYPQCQELFLVRDFRDVVCSRQSFTARRYVQGQPPAAKTIRGAQRKARVLLDAWRRRGERSLLVRYEDLVLQPVDTLKSICRHLGIDHAHATIEALVQRASQESLKHHVTASDPVRSIGRWRRDLSREHQVMCQELLGETLHAFGYSVEQSIEEAA